MVYLTRSMTILLPNVDVDHCRKYLYHDDLYEYDHTIVYRQYTGSPSGMSGQERHRDVESSCSRM